MPSPRADIAIRLGSALIPLLLTPVLVWLVAEGYLSLGSGEKDLLIAVPWLVWALAFMVVALLAWYRRLSLSRALVLAAIGATGVLGVAGAALFWWTARG